MIHEVTSCGGELTTSQGVEIAKLEAELPETLAALEGATEGTFYFYYYYHRYYDCYELNIQEHTMCNPRFGTP
jgi:hypothetical protein